MTPTHNHQPGSGMSSQDGCDLSSRLPKDLESFTQFIFQELHSIRIVGMETLYAQRPPIGIEMGDPFDDLHDRFFQSHILSQLNIGALNLFHTDDGFDTEKGPQ